MLMREKQQQSSFLIDKPILSFVILFPLSHRGEDYKPTGISKASGVSPDA